MSKKKTITSDAADQTALKQLASFVDDLIVRNCDLFKTQITRQEKVMLLSSTASLQNIAQEINRLRTGK